MADKEQDYDDLTMVRMAIVERDDRLVILMPKDATEKRMNEFLEGYKNLGWPADRIMVVSGPEAFAVIKPSQEDLLLPANGTFRVTEDGQVSDGHHTHKELYRYRLLYNAALFNEWSKLGLYDTHKSRRHHDGELPFGDAKWFIVVAQLPTGQISNHYRVTDWDLFDIEARELPAVYDGHTPAVVAERLEEFLHG